MKKTILAATIAAALTLSTGAALANPVTFDGSASTQFRHNTADHAASTDGNKQTFILNATSDLGNNYTFFARIAAQHATMNSGADFQRSIYSSNYAVAVDQFGVKYNGGNWNATIGRQAMTVGATGILYDNSGYLGRGWMNDGVTITRTIDNATYTLLAAQEDRNGSDNKLYSLHADFKTANDLTLGATLAKYDYETNVASNTALKDDPTYWAINANYALGKANLFTEYAKSSVDTKNKALAIGAAYDFDGKNSLTVVSHKTEGNADMGAGNTTFDNNEKGFYYTYNHAFDKQTSLTLVYKDNKNIDTNDKNTSFRTTVSYKF